MALWDSLLRASTVHECLGVLLAHTPPPGSSSALYYQVAPGNGGEALLGVCLLDLLRQLPGWRAVPGPPCPGSAVEASTSLAIYGGGGGSLVPGCSACPDFVGACAAAGVRVLILPSAVRGCQAFLQGQSSASCILFCRDSASLQHCEAVRSASAGSGPRLKADHDLALQHLHPPAPAAAAEAAAVLWCFAPGTEQGATGAAPPPPGATVEDLPARFPVALADSPQAIAATAAAFLAALAPFATIHTNRLHVAIAAQRLNVAAVAAAAAGAAEGAAAAPLLRRILLYDTPCGKNSAVFHASQAHLPHVALVPPPAAAAAGAAAPPPPPLLILYSPTRQATDVAQWVSSEATRRALPHALRSLATFPMAQLPSHAAALFIVPTWGDGEWPAPALPAWRHLLQRSLPPHTLAATACAVIGLGDSAYTRYNAAARKLGARLAQLGAQALCGRCLADWQGEGGYIAAVHAWLEGQLWPALGVGEAVVGRDNREVPLHPRWLVQALQAEEQEALGLGEREALCPLPLPMPPLDGFVCASSSSDSSDSSSPGSEGAELPALPLRPFVATVQENRRLTAQEWQQDVRHLRMAEWRPAEGGAAAAAAAASASAAATAAPLLPHPTWQAGDVAVVAVEAPPADVLALCQWLGLPPSLCLRLTPLDGNADDVDSTPSPPPPPGANPLLSPPLWCHASSGGAHPPFPRHPLPPTLTLRTLLARYLDILQPPSRAALRQLSLYARQWEQGDKLKELGSVSGGGLYSEYCVKEGRGWGEVLQDFPSLRGALPLALLLELMPRLAPRHYSAASSCCLEAEGGAGSSPALELCVARLVYSTRLGRQKAGCASSFLCNLAVGARVGVWMRVGSLRFPPPGSSSSSSGASGATVPPLILVGPGTGIAPMRALVSQRARQQALCPALAPLAPPPTLYFGCRHAAMDDLYGQEMRALVAEGSLGGYHCAYSRDGGGGEGRVYVQSLLRGHSEEVGRVLRAGGCLYFAGSASSGVVEGVRGALVGALGGLEGGGKEAVAALEKARRVVFEAW